MKNSVQNDMTMEYSRKYLQSEIYGKGRIGNILQKICRRGADMKRRLTKKRELNISVVQGNLITIYLHLLQLMHIIYR